MILFTSSNDDDDDGDGGTVLQRSRGDVFIERREQDGSHQDGKSLLATYFRQSSTTTSQSKESSARVLSRRSPSSLVNRQLGGLAIGIRKIVNLQDGFEVAKILKSLIVVLARCMHVTDDNER